MYNGLTLLRCVAAFMIVGCHLQLFPRTSAGMAFTSLCDMNVGLFGAISGFLMAVSLDRRNCQIRDYATRRVCRLVPVYFFWTIFYLLASIVFSFALNGKIAEGKYSDPYFWLGVVLWGNASCHLWFVASLLYANIILSLCYAVLKKLKISALIFLVLGIVLVSLATYSREFIFRYPCRLFGFVSLGVFAKLFLGRINVSKRLGVILLCAGLATHFLMKGYLHSFVRDMMVVLPVMFVFAREGISLHGGRFVDSLAGCSMGVFLWHPFFAAGMAAIIPHFFAVPFGVGIVLGDWILVYIIALIGAIAMKRVPLFERFVR